MAFLELLFPSGSCRITKILRRIAKIADHKQIKAYLVGGVIRDRILGHQTKDIDVTVIGNGIEFAKAIAHSFRLKKVLEYPRFGTAMVPYHDIVIEVATARSEKYENNSRKPSVREANLYEDLSRRDFTVNALAMSLNEDSLFQFTDYFEGLKDLDAGIIRTPLDPVITFSEDPLRMLRAIRFASQLGFKIEDETFRTISKVKDRMEIISQERITEELTKILKVPQKPSRAFYLMEESGLLEIILPEIARLDGVDQKNGYHHKDVFRHSLQVLDNISKATDKFELRFTALVHDIAKPQTKKYIEDKGWTFYGHEELGARMVKRLARRLKMSNKVMDYAEKMTRLHLRPIAIAEEGVTASAVRRLCVDAGEHIDDLITLCRADITSKNLRKVAEFTANFDRVVDKIAEVEEKDRLRAFQSPVRGDEIMELCKLPPGPAVGYIKHAIEEAILSGEIPNNYDAAKLYLESHKERLLSDI
ncbi:MAG: CCA tRNA nucleotidyltransferase [Candidatus Marinimicrobia bacterium]|nr:CCA tRNA nucleotidyltransferase [bacterium]MCG2714939.1 CCA tRNA nucleotidyltransferase [Candidatus Neomarinimicrobiota bacterium]